MTSLKYIASSLVASLLCLLKTNTLEARSRDSLAHRATPDTLPAVFSGVQGHLVESKLRHEAAFLFPLHQLPQKVDDINKYRNRLREKIVQTTGVLPHQNLPLQLKETGSVKLKGYTIKNISFQTRPGTLATANMYVPDGKGKFPAVIVMMGHSSNGRFYDKYQSVSTTLAQNGYVALSIDPWGSGERTTVHGAFEDHGDENNLGAAIMNVGQTMMGMLLTDNIRGVDLLLSLPYVDRDKIGATGSSGGGNQTMWLTAIDERIKAAVPVVSVGTFESYIMGTPCFCEVLPGGLTFAEEAGVLSLIAPRALKMCNHHKDANQAFYPKEMLRTYHNVKPVYERFGAKNKVGYETFDLPHGYFAEDRQAMLGWFNLYLKNKGDGSPVKETEIIIQPQEQLMTYSVGKRDEQVTTTEQFCKTAGSALRSAYLQKGFFDAAAKRNQLREILKATESSLYKKVHTLETTDGWQRLALETSDNKLIPLLLHLPAGNVNKIVVVTSPRGKEGISPMLIAQLKGSGAAIAVVELSGSGETGSTGLHSFDSTGRFRTMSKSLLWLGKTLMGEWVKELDVVSQFLRKNHKTASIEFVGDREAGLAGLYLAALKNSFNALTLQQSPVSYLFDNRDGIEFFSTGIHIPGFLQWGDVSLATALTGKPVTFVDPVTMSGRMIETEGRESWVKEFVQIRKSAKQPGTTLFK